MKMKQVYEANPALGDPMSIQGQLADNGHRLDKLRAELKKYQVRRSCVFWLFWHILTTNIIFRASSTRWRVAPPPKPTTLLASGPQRRRGAPRRTCPAPPGPLASAHGAAPCPTAPRASAGRPPTRACREGEGTKGRSKWEEEPTGKSFLKHILVVFLWE